MYMYYCKYNNNTTQVNNYNGVIIKTFEIIAFRF